MVARVAEDLKPWRERGGMRFSANSPIEEFQRRLEYLMGPPQPGQAAETSGWIHSGSFALEESSHAIAFQYSEGMYRFCDGTIYPHGVFYESHDRRRFFIALKNYILDHAAACNYENPHVQYWIV